MDFIKLSRTFPSKRGWQRRMWRGLYEPVSIEDDRGLCYGGGWDNLQSLACGLTGGGPRIQCSEAAPYISQVFWFEPGQCVAPGTTRTSQRSQSGPDGKPADGTRGGRAEGHATQEGTWGEREEEKETEGRKERSVVCVFIQIHSLRKIFP